MNLPTSFTPAPGSRLSSRTAVLALSGAGVVALVGGLVVPRVLGTSDAAAATFSVPHVAHSAAPTTASSPSVTASAAASAGADHGPRNPYQAPAGYGAATGTGAGSGSAAGGGTAPGGTASGGTATGGVVIVGSPPAASGSFTSSPSTAPASPAGTVSIPPVVGVPTPAPLTPATSATPTPSLPPITLTLVSVTADDSAVEVEVAGKQTQLALGKSTKGGVTLVRAEGGACATFDYSGVRRDVCAGGSVTLG